MRSPKVLVLFAVWLAVAGSWPAAAQTPGAVRVQGQEQPNKPNQPQGTAGEAPGSTPSTPGISSPAPGTPVPGKVRAQGREVIPEKPAAPARRPGPRIDYQEEMRRFVRDISVFAHRYRSDFLVVAQNGLGLLDMSKPDSEEPVPALGYMYALDGILQEGLFFGGPHSEPAKSENKATEKEPAKDTPVNDPANGPVNSPVNSHERLLKLADMAKKGGLKVMVMDYTTDRREISQSFRKSAARGYVSFAAPARGAYLNRLPSYARYPFNENGRSVLSLKNVKNFIAIRNSSPFGLPEEFAYEIRNTNFDLVVVDVFHGTVPLPKKIVRSLKFKKLGAQRLVFAYVNIARAARYRYYWKEEWREGSPPWIGSPAPGNPAQHQVDYWERSWQRIISGDTQSFIYGIIDQGFDGVVLDGLESYQAYLSPDAGY